VVGEGDHIFELPKDGAGEAVEEVLEGDELLRLALGEEGLHVPAKG
jgi:hypothetical protein